MADRKRRQSQLATDLLEQLLGPSPPSQADAAAEKLGQIFRQQLSSKHLQIFLEAAGQGPASKRLRRDGEAGSSDRAKSLQQLSELFPHCVDPAAFEALAPHLHLSPPEWSQVWPAFQFKHSATEASALVSLISLAAAKNRGLVDVVVHLVTLRSVKLNSFREAVAQAVPQELASQGRWIDEELPPRSRNMRDVLCQCFVGLFPLCQEGDQGPTQTWNFDTWWTELTTSLQGAAPGAALALVATTLLQLQRKGPLTLELVLRPKRRRKIWTWLTQQAQMLPEAQSVASFMARLGRHSMQVGPRQPMPEAVDLEAEEVPSATLEPEDKVELVSEMADDLREAAWYQTAT